MVHLVTGGAGFVAANLIPALLRLGHEVVAVDNLIRGRREFLSPLVATGGVTFVEADCSNPHELEAAISSSRVSEITDVWHLAANSDIPAGISDPYVDLQHTFMTTFATLSVMRNRRIGKIHFASSSAIYGDFADLRISEDMAPYKPISNYGAMKLASEGQISAACESFLERANIFRFPNVVGTPATHGVILDFIGKLAITPQTLNVLGNGTQQKVYLHVDDLVSAMLFISENSRDKYNVFNIGPSDDGVTVKFIAETVRDIVSPRATILFGEGQKGWVGDVPRFRYNVELLARLGWRTSMDSSNAVKTAVRQIAMQEGSA
ncbi:NAD-dependent epimerase/dehydratase family protein [Methylobacterium gnaphalii]|uniref:UDP-glucose 4-epimerase n=1 Tax=Methylobacterium gnaphalii TaxID=1010610 RepID=A0A512JRN7_9HYPH|nr:NAD-dependent epimerase/dehydratase family protein [Methylobacterium gnaphalii]GEP12582.1 UDP-glucose 4-epimerase [Methylobacterium gnaphalii]GJD69992.1 ADP-L-glycero-D-manno-heptose-6-epimerase [Methylobacterium gnaphalii]GLS51349.1 UDP-glucose 4-epimerase [Methylobacterium gnaphalii]